MYGSGGVMGGPVASFQPAGGAGGSGPGSKGLSILAVVCGSAGGPTNGLFTYTNAALIGATNVDVIVVNNVNEVVVGAIPDFSFVSGTGTITRNNAWVTGDTLIVWYTPA